MPQVSGTILSLSFVPADGLPSSGFERPETPPSENEQQPVGSAEQGEVESQSPPRKKGGFDSRIEQILYEHSDLQIIITDAGKNHESGGSYIAYTIRTGVGCPNMCMSQLTMAGSGSQEAIFRLQFAASDSGQLAPDLDHSTDP